MNKIIFVFGIILLTAVSAKNEQMKMKEMFAKAAARPIFSGRRPTTNLRVTINQLVKDMSTKLITIASTVDKTKIASVGSLGIPPHAVENL